MYNQNDNTPPNINFLYHCFTYVGSKAVIIFSVTPESRNVSEGMIVEFSCATPDSGVFLNWQTKPLNVDIGYKLLVFTPPEGGKLSLLSFTATAQHNNISIMCLAVKVPNSNQSTALLLVQGKPTNIGQSL